jgi:hypothetical protein
MTIESATNQAKSYESAANQAKSYRYLRLAMVGLLLALGAAVIYQSIQQDSVLSSVSAYYYTPAQGVFVGALIGLGAIMIAMQGMNGAENMFLNLGGMFAIVVAIVPTGRGPDFETAVQACQKSGGTLLTHRTSNNSDCSTVLGLVEAAKENVQNNMVALLIAGFLVLVVTGFFLLKSWTAKSGKPERPWAIAGFLAAFGVWLCGLIALEVSVDWLAANGHYIAGAGLLVSVIMAAASNAYRRRDFAASAGRPVVVRWLINLAALMVGVSVFFIVLWVTNVVSLFVLEIVVAFLFVLFWTVQTVELEYEARDREIRRMHHSGDYNAAQIAAVFNVSRRTVERSLKRENSGPPECGRTG